MPIGSKPLSQRNRIISGLALAVVIVEASLKSGSLITANYALEQNREVFAAPGFPLDPRCMGTNRLIKDGAYLLESSADIISNMATYQKLKKSLEETQNSSNNFNFPIGDDNLAIKESDRQVVVKLLSSSPVTFELLSHETKLSLPVI